MPGKPAVMQCFDDTAFRARAERSSQIRRQQRTSAPQTRTATCQSRAVTSMRASHQRLRNKGDCIPESTVGSSLSRRPSSQRRLEVMPLETRIPSFTQRWLSKSRSKHCQRKCQTARPFTQPIRIPKLPKPGAPSEIKETTLSEEVVQPKSRKGAREDGLDPP